jgi:hypothetical protein
MLRRIPTTGVKIAKIPVGMEIWKTFAISAM